MIGVCAVVLPVRVRASHVSEIRRGWAADTQIYAVGVRLTALIT